MEPSANRSLSERRQFLELPKEERDRILLNKQRRWRISTKTIQNGGNGKEAPLSSMILPNPRRGEVWDVNFDPTVGTEIQKNTSCRGGEHQ